MFRDFHRWTVPLGNSFCKLSLSRFYVNVDEELLNLLGCQALTSFLKAAKDVAFHSIILFENSAILWLVARLAYVNNVDKVMKNYVCSRKRNFHVRVSVDTLACHAVTVCKFANLHVVTIISRKTLFVTKSNFLTSIWVIKFSISQFHIIYICHLSFTMFIRKHASATLWIIKLAFMQI